MKSMKLIRNYILNLNHYTRRLKMKKLITITFVSLMLLCGAAHADSTWVDPGTIAGETWTAGGSPYCITGDMFISYLTIQPSVDVLFFGDYDFDVSGLILAVGTQQDSIRFTRAHEDSARWGGMLLDNVIPGSELAYCQIEFATAPGLRIEDSPDLEMRNCTISNHYRHISNQSITLKAGGIYVIGMCTLSDCQISDNELSAFHSSIPSYNIMSMGGGIYTDGDLTLINCKITGNSISARTHYIGSMSHTRGGGIYTIGSLTLRCSEIYNNVAHAYSDSYSDCDSRGGGIYISGDLVTTNSIIAHNEANAGPGYYLLRHGSGIYMNSGTMADTNSTVAYNNYQGLFNNSATVTIMNSIYYSNEESQISGSATVDYSNIEGGWTGGTGNISYNPVFYNNTDSLHIVEVSPCVDAGNPDPMYNDPEDPLNPGFATWPSWGTVRNDMGAHGGPGAPGWEPAHPIIAVNPQLLDFGTVVIGNEVDLPLTISNVGDADLILSDVYTSNLVFTTDFDTTNAVIVPYGSLEITVTFDPVSPIPYDEILTIENNDVLTTVSLLGIGTEPGWIGVSLTPYGAPIVVPEEGGSFDFNIAIQNWDSGPQSFDLWTQIELPGGSTVEVMSISGLTLPGNALVDRDRTQYVPEYAPSGTYTYHGYVGTYPWVVDSTDAFTFEKAGTGFNGSAGSSADWLCMGEPFDQWVAEAEVEIPDDFALHGASPNPFNPTTTFSFTLPEATDVTLTVYDVSGRQVSTLVDGQRNAGVHEAVFDGAGLASGVYLYHLSTGEYQATGKMVLMK